MHFSFFASQTNLGNNAYSADLHVVFIRVVGFVWRQSGFAFFGAQLRLRTFLFLGDIHDQENAEKNNTN